jgi:D-alanyl-D-alanine endopeptidase (penicillin-binding protein 7)
MPEARLHRVSSPVSPVIRLAAVALCAAAFLLPAAAQAGKREAPVAKKSVASSDSKRKVAASASKRTRAAAVEEKSVRGGRDVVATIRKKNGKTVVAVQRRSVVRVAEPARLSYGQMAGLHRTDDALDLK